MSMNVYHSISRYVLESWLLLVSEYFERDGQSGHSRMLTWWFRLRTIRVMHWTRIQACGAITWSPWETERSTWSVVGVAIRRTKTFTLYTSWDHYQHSRICGMFTVSKTNRAGFCPSTVYCHGLPAELFGPNSHFWRIILSCKMSVFL